MNIKYPYASQPQAVTWVLMSRLSHVKCTGVTCHTLFLINHTPPNFHFIVYIYIYIALLSISTFFPVTCPTDVYIIATSAMVQLYFTWIGLLALTLAYDDYQLSVYILPFFSLELREQRPWSVDSARLIAA